MTKPPTILATSGGIRPGRRTRWEFSPLTDFAVELAGVSGRAPRLCFLATASGDSSFALTSLYEAAALRGFQASHLSAFSMPNLPDPEAHLLAQDVIWVLGGSVAGLCAIWRLHGWDDVLRRAWQAGVVLTGISAGSICWHVGGTTDSFGPELRAFTDGLGFLPHSNGVHYDSEPQRRPLFQAAVADGTLPPGFATEDGVGLLYRGTELVEAVGEIDGRAAFSVEPGPDRTATETRLEVRRL